MKVKDLQALLSLLPPEYDIVIPIDKNSLCTVTDLVARHDTKTLYITNFTVHPHTAMIISEEILRAQTK